jgi:hypothetical protein
MKTLLFLSLAFALSLGACSKTKDGGGEASSKDPGKTDLAKNEGPRHAPKDVVPGSYEDWCGEHQVPESQCTQCDPSLAAAFKATGDWCEEHGLPKSHDRKHNPELKLERPAKP